MRPFDVIETKIARRAEMRDRAPPVTREELFEFGTVKVGAVCRRNAIAVPVIVTEHKRWPFTVPAYYRDGTIHINVGKCAMLGESGRNWSWPGYAVDRTPAGVLLHELGHHFDWTSGKAKIGSYWTALSHALEKGAGEPAITGYEGSKLHERFAERFRLFSSNPALLKALSPKFFAAAADHWLHGPFIPYDEAIVGRPERQVRAARNCIDAAAGKR